jgi:hypothetical protein
MLKFLKKRKERQAKERETMKKRTFVYRLKNGKPPSRRPMMKVTGNYGKM